MFFSIFYSFWLCLEKQGAPTNRGCTIYYHSILTNFGQILQKLFLFCLACTHTSQWLFVSYQVAQHQDDTIAARNLELGTAADNNDACSRTVSTAFSNWCTHIYAPICLMLLKVGFIVDVFPNIQGSCPTFPGRISAEQLLSVERVQYCPASV